MYNIFRVSTVARYHISTVRNIYKSYNTDNSSLIKHALSSIIHILTYLSDILFFVRMFIFIIYMVEILQEAYLDFDNGLNTEPVHL